MAGGELLIPALVLIFGADIKTAGSASILISLGIVSVGLWRYWRVDAIPCGRGAAETIVHEKIEAELDRLYPNAQNKRVVEYQRNRYISEAKGARSAFTK